ncbi:hypothetical protein MLD38_006555 [Melastoma candidum]|uniref:Uncharacterized protein n=1 Tax=Melastoma candidum TaxID=119954 RepID=A0ACB9RMH5_9MYRT|nr:hypothetical protein MLD38_006555 [Melastoma candidum]
MISLLPAWVCQDPGPSSFRVSFFASRSLELGVSVWVRAAAAKDGGGHEASKGEEMSELLPRVGLFGEGSLLLDLSGRLLWAWRQGSSERDVGPSPLDSEVGCQEQRSGEPGGRQPRRGPSLASGRSLSPGRHRACR